MTNAAKLFADLQLPPHLNLESADPVQSAGTNSVFFCRGRLRGSEVTGYLKVADRGVESVANERAILERIHATEIPVPAVVAFGGPPKQFLFLASVPGETLWDLIDPRKSDYRKAAVTRNLQAYGATLGQIHGLAIDWSDQRRTWLERLIGDERGSDPRSQALVAWLVANRPTRIQRTFVHGDFNTANVLIQRGAISGVLDWEFAGTGWKEYEIAWALRARVHFLNSIAERDAILSGYERYGHFEPTQLRWCEVLNYVHFANWAADSDPSYREFALARAETAAGASM